MGIDSRQEELIQRLTIQERLLSRLYAVFSSRFPEYEDFWAGLSKEEEAHARVIEKLTEAGKKGIVLFDEGRINVHSLNTSIQGLKKLIQKAEQSEFTLSSAVSCAMDYESALIEKNAFARFNPIHKKAKTALDTLQHETMKHIERIKKLKMDVCST